MRGSCSSSPKIAANSSSVISTSKTCGADSLPGLLVGAGVLYVLDYRADDVTRWVDHLPAVHLNPQRLGMSSVIFGAALILVMIALPRGAGGLLRRLLGPLASRLYSRS